MELIKIDNRKAEKMYYTFYSFCLNRGISTHLLRSLFNKHRLFFFLAAELADTNSASYKDWIAAQFNVLSDYATFVKPSFLYSKAAEKRYDFYMKRKLRITTPEEKEIYFFEYVKLMREMRKISFTDALKLAVRFNFISVNLSPKILARYKESNPQFNKNLD